jgi:hypothetical protein
LEVPTLTPSIVGDLFVFESFHIVQDKDGSISRWEIGDRLVEGDAVDETWLYR